jgi:hypothetical protein
MSFAKSYPKTGKPAKRQADAVRAEMIRPSPCDSGAEVDSPNENSEEKSNPRERKR